MCELYMREYVVKVFHVGLCEMCELYMREYVVKVFHVGLCETCEQYMREYVVKVFHVGLCETCEQYMREHDLVPVDLFIVHIRRVLDYVHSHHPDIQVIMWDDMFRGIDLQVLQGLFHPQLSRVF